MKAYDLIELAAHNLRESVLRNSLTTLGISVGVASLVAMLSLGIGLQNLADRHLKTAGLFDTVVVSSRRDFRYNREDERASTAQIAKARSLDEPARVEIERLPNVTEADPDIRFITELQYQSQPHLTMVAGLPFSMKDNDAFDGMQGKFFSSDSAPEALIQKSFAEELLGREEKPGSEINIAELAKPLLGQELGMRYAERVASQDNGSSAYSVVQREQGLKIVGISDLDPDVMRGSARARVFVPLRLAENLHMMQPSDLRDSMRAFSSTPTYLTVTVHVKSPSRVRSVQDAINKLGFSTFSILDATKSLQRFFAILDLFLGIFGSLALAVASLGIVNTLVMAILERRREIGIMKAIGGSDQDVKKLFFVEAGSMGVLGGAVGVALGWLIGRAINFGTNIYLQRQELPPEHIWLVPWWLIFGAIAFALLVSLFSGLYPAARAARLDPVQALRYE